MSAVRGVSFTEKMKLVKNLVLYLMILDSVLFWIIIIFSLQF